MIRWSMLFHVQSGENKYLHVANEEENDQNSEFKDFDRALEESGFCEGHEFENYIAQEDEQVDAKQ